MIIPFGEYKPDLLEFGDHCLDATGVFPTQGGYRSVYGSEQIAAATIGDTTKGVFCAKSFTGAAKNFVATDSNLYTFTSSTATNVSKSASAYSTSSAYWEFTKFSNSVLAVNGSATGDVIQQYEIDTATTFTDVAGAPNASTIATVKDFVVVGNTWDSTDGRRPGRVRWSAIGDHTSWTVSAVTQADYNDLPSGEVQAVRGGEYGVVVTDNSVWRMSYVGSPIVFQFDEVLPGIGTTNPASVVRADSYVFMWASDGFRVITDGSGSQRIGKGRVDKLAQTLFTDATNVKGIVDPYETRVYWGRSAGGLWLCYDWSIDRWSRMNATSSLYFGGGIESLGCAFGLGGVGDAEESIAMFKSLPSAGTLYTFGYSASTTQAATIKSAFRELTPNRHTMVTRLRPIASGGDGTRSNVSVATRNDLNEVSGAELAYTETFNNGTGTFTCRASGRYHSFESISGGPTSIIYEIGGVQVDAALPRGFR